MSPCYRQFGGLITMVALFLGLLVTAPPAYAATLTVTDGTDPGAATCEATCTLRAALEAAAPGDTIQFQIRHYTIRLSSPLVLTKDVTIQGLGPSYVTIDGQGTVQPLRVNSGVHATISGITIQNGKSDAMGLGGGIYNDGTLSLMSSIVTSNVAQSAGGGIFSNNAGTLTLDGVLVSDNTLTYGLGGGVAVLGTGGLTMRNSAITGNTVPDGWGGGGIFIGSNTGPATIINSTISGNLAKHSNPLIGGGILSYGALSLTDSVVSGNLASGAGGGVAVRDGSATITRSTVNNNRAWTGAGISNIGNTSVTVSDSTVSGNEPHGAETTSGGGIATGDSDSPSPSNVATTTVNNSTISGNTATRGGGLMVSADGRLIVSNSTVSGNRATTGGGLVVFGGTATMTYATLSGNGATIGGGIARTGGTARLRNSIVVNSPSGGNCSGLVDSDGNNLSDSTTCFAGGTSGDIVSPAPGVDTVLKVNSPGAAATHALLSGSPAIDGVIFSPTDCGGSVTTDQRGVTRPQAHTGARCDIGAFELAATAPPTISPIGPQTTGEDTPTNAINFTVDDDETPAASLVVTARSSNQAIVPDAKIVLAGSGQSRSVTITPVADRNGTADITVIVADAAGLQASSTFTLTVTPVNDAPTISSIDDQVADQTSSTPTIPFSIGDDETAPDTLVVTATSSDQTLVPNANIALSGTGAARAIRVTPAPNRSGTATIDVKVSDGSADAHETFTVTVLAVAQVPTAASDSYTLVIGQSLTVPPGQGVLANDRGSGASPLTAAVDQRPAHGKLDLDRNGGFTYTPATGFTGTDTFSYRAADGSAASAPATVTLTITATDCSPRPRVVSTPTATGGRLAVHVEATPLNSRANNPLRTMQFGQIQNARVTLNGQTIVSGQPVAVPANAVAIDFTIERVTAGQPMMVPFTVVDGCGSWPTFVGGGPDATL